jgi:hypothetical protein
VSDDFVIFAGSANPGLASAIRRKRAGAAGGGRPARDRGGGHPCAAAARRAREKLARPAIREVFVTDTVAVEECERPRIRVVSVAELIAGALEWSLDWRVRRHEPTIVP